MADKTTHRSQRVVVHEHRPRQQMPDGEVMVHEDGMLQDITGSTYVRMTPEEWESKYALSEHQPKDRSGRRQ